MSQEKKLFLLDAYALIYRAYYAFISNPRINSKNQNTSAIFGFANTLLDVLQKQKPTHIAVVFDADATTTREAEFSAYKANRQAMPEDIRFAVPWIKKMVEAFNIPSLESPGYEADDIIGTLAKKAEKAGFVTYMMTPDKDFGQLVSENIFMYKPARMGNAAEVWGIKEVCERYGIERPTQVIDILGLMGDAVDNIPGIAGVGEKTAIKFVQDYGSVEGLLEHVHELKGKMKEKVEAGREMALLSKQLATIMLDAPVEFDEQALRLEDPNKEALMTIFQELEFRQLAQRLFSENIEAPVLAGEQMDLFASATATLPPPAKALSDEENTDNISLKTLSDFKVDYQLVENEKALSALIQVLENAKRFCFDTETTGLDVYADSVIGMSFAVEPAQAFYVPIPKDFEEAKSLIQRFARALADAAIEKVGQNCKFDILMLKKYGITVKGAVFDTMIAHYLLDPDSRKRSMDQLAMRFLQYQPISITQLIGEKGKDQKSMADVPLSQIKDYACEDADITLQLKNVFEPMLAEQGLSKLFVDIEAPLVGVLADMEAEGIAVDVDSLKQFSADLEIEITAKEKEVYDAAGMKFNIGSPKQVGELLFEHLKVVEKPKKTKTGQYATSEDILAKIAGKHPVVDHILDYRELVKLKNTYVDPLPEMILPHSGHIHTSFNQIVAATGRLSSDRPNLQNIPIRTERGQRIRSAFVARNPEYILMSSDYSQIELRIMAHLSQDAGMMEAFNQHLDIHAATAAKVFDVAVDAVSRDQRSKAKMVNFGIIYGISAFGLSERLSIPRAEAKHIIDAYFEKYPGVKTYMDEAVAKAKKQHYVETILGRKRWLRDITSANAVVRGHAERNAINAPIQGSAADMIKIAMINIHKSFEQKKFKSKMLLQVHDELVFDVFKPEKEEVKAVVESQMKSAIEMSVPLEVESGFGTNWLQAH